VGERNEPYTFLCLSYNYRTTFIDFYKSLQRPIRIMGSGLSVHRDELPSSSSNDKNQAGASGQSSSLPATDNADNDGGGCPMKRSDGSYSFDWGALFRKDFPHGPAGRHSISEQEARRKIGYAGAGTVNDNDDDGSGGGGCPVKRRQPRQNKSSSFPEYNVYSQPIDPSNNMPAAANQTPSPGQSKSLSTERVASSIPKGGGGGNSSKEEEEAVATKTWVYPSAQMFYNALTRKGKLGDTDEEDIENVVAMHNNMNEKTWKKVLEWERALDGESSQPTLLKFQGRPTDLSPKAAFKHYVLGHPLPYDRHDWTVLRDDGTTVRYVIDYYYDESRASDSSSSAMPRLDNPDATPSLLVDVRPALDGPTLAWNRVATMPYARRVARSTQFEPLPMFPTNDMQSQVQESVQVWKSIQANAKGGSDGQEQDDTTTVAGGGAGAVTESDARELASSFAKIRGACHVAASRVDECDSELDCAKASMDLTTCMGKIVCPLQHAALVSALGGSDGNDAAIDAAITSISECVALKSSRKAEAKEKFPNLFK